MIYNQAMCSETEAAEIAGFMTQAADLIKQGDFLGSFNVWDKFLNGDIWPYGNWYVTWVVWRGCSSSGTCVGSCMPLWFSQPCFFVGLFCSP